MESDLFISAWKAPLQTSTVAPSTAVFEILWGFDALYHWTDMHQYKMDVPNQLCVVISAPAPPVFCWWWNAMPQNVKSYQRGLPAVHCIQLCNQSCTHINVQ